MEGLTRVLLPGRRAVSDRGRPPLRRSHPPVEGIVPGISVQRVVRVLHLVILKISGLVAGLYGDFSLLSLRPPRRRLPAGPTPDPARPPLPRPPLPRRGAWGGSAPPPPT